MKTTLAAALAVVALQCLPVRAADTAPADTEKKAVTNTLERFHTRRATCHWTDEMGKYIFDCLRANFNMNAHWCHNEAMALYCAEETAKAPEAGRPAN